MAKISVLLTNMAMTAEKKHPDFYDIGPPYSLAVIGATLKQAGIAVKCYDCNITPLNETLQQLQILLKKYRPEIAGIACESWTRASLKPTIEIIRNFSKQIRIIVGGSLASQYFPWILKHGKADCVIIGEGEISMREITQALLQNKPFHNIPGIALYQNNKIVVTKPRLPLMDIDSLPFPAYELFDDLEQRIKHAIRGSKDYLGLNPFTNIINKHPCSVIRTGLVILSTRGCVGKCVFCPNSKIIKNKIRLHSARYFLDMIEYFIKTYNLRDFIFGDNFFTYNKQRTLEICNGIQKRRFSIRWACATRFDHVDAELLTEMKKAGCVNIGYGLESFSPVVQQKMNKNLNLSKIDSAYKMTHNLGINSELMLMVGNPGDSPDAVRKTQGKARVLDPTTAYTQIAQIYPNTKLFDLAVQNNIMDPQYFESEEYTIPYYTAQHSPTNLKLMASMIQNRKVYLNLSYLYNNDYSHIKPQHKLTAKRLISLASSRSRYLALYGGNNLLNQKDFLNILEMIKQAGINTLYIYINPAHILPSPEVTQKINNSGLKIIFMFPFFGPNEKQHDAITGQKGSFQQIIQNAQQWKETAAGIYIVKNNANDAYGFLKQHLGKTFSGVNFIFHEGTGWYKKIHRNNLPRWRDIKSALKDAINLCLKDAGEVSFTGLPECMLSEFQGLIVDSWRPLDEGILPDGKIRNLSRYRETKKIKTQICKSCSWEKSCEGLWKFYAADYGDGDMLSQK